MARTKKAKAAGQVAETLIAYKAFGAEWKCRDFAYEVGKTYEHDGRLELCGSGFHACLVPFDCWDYYPGSDKLARVTLSDVLDRTDGDSKRCAAKITIEASLTLPEWIKAQADAVIGLCRAAKKALASDADECAAATGDSGHAAATGYRGHAAATGDYGHAAATSYKGHAAATGNYGHAAATGDRGHAAATGKHAIAASLGIYGTAKAGPDGWIVLAAHDDEFNLVCVRTAKVGGPEGIKAHTAYRLNTKGEFEEAH